jgi:hypothetical protein
MLSSETKLIVSDDFYQDPLSIRHFALQQTFFPHPYHPGNRSKSFLRDSDSLKTRIQSLLPESAGKIVLFKSVKNNCSFQINLANERSWIHSDYTTSNWAGVVYLTPNPGPNSGTGFYKFRDGTLSSINDKNNLSEIRQSCYDLTQWELVSQVDNVFNRLVLYDSRQYHQSTGYFGDNIDNGRLVQLFFFTTQF